MIFLTQHINAWKKQHMNENNKNHQKKQLKPRKNEAPIW